MTTNIIWALLLLLAIPIVHYGKQLLQKLYHQQKNSLQHLLKDKKFQNEMEFDNQLNRLEALRVYHGGAALSRWALLISGVYVLVTSLV
ncbi:MAG: hypothetical protein ACK4RM_10430 [Flavobacterium sp.]